MEKLQKLEKYSKASIDMAITKNRLRFYSNFGVSGRDHWALYIQFEVIGIGLVAAVLCHSENTIIFSPNIIEGTSW
jgi:hypothetical protein